MTDQTSAHDPLERLRAGRHDLDAALDLRAARPAASTSSGPWRRWPSTCGPCSPSSAAARSRSTTATTSAPRRRRPGVDERLRLPRLRARLHPAAVLRGQGAVPLGGAVGRPGGHRADRRGRPASCSPTTRRCTLDPPGARDASPFQGLPARICWLGYGERAKAGLALQRAGRVAARSARRSSSAATTSTPARSPRPTARRRRCATAPTPSPTGRSSTRWSTRPRGATWVSFHHGGGVGIGY